MNLNAFSLKRFNELCETLYENEIDENIFLSPLSVSLTLSMLLSGSDETTEERLKDALGFVENTDVLERLLKVSDALNYNSESLN